MSIRDEIQANALRSILNNHYEGIYFIAPRVGKSKITLDSFRQIPPHVKILIIAPQNPILKSWNREIIKWEPHIIPKVMNQRSLHKVKEGEYDLIVADEIHTLSDNQLNELVRIKPKKVLGLTGSLARKTVEKLRSYGLKVVYSYSINQAIKDGIISNFKIKVIKVKMTPHEQVTYNNLTKKFEKLKELEYQSMGTAGKRANFIYTCQSKINAVKKLIPNVDRALIFTARKKACNQLNKDFFHSTSKGDELDLFIDKKIDKLAVIETVQMGVTIPDLKIGIFHQLKSSEESSIQKIMRMCNLEDSKEAVIYIFVLQDTVDEKWTENALRPFSSDKIEYIEYEDKP